MRTVDFRWSQRVEMAIAWAFPISVLALLPLLLFWRETALPVVGLVSEGCVQCGACVVQCPFDALFFESPSGDVVTAATVRRFKLNLLGRRLAAGERTDRGIGSGR